MTLEASLLIIERKARMVGVQVDVADSVVRIAQGKIQPLQNNLGGGQLVTATAQIDEAELLLLNDDAELLSLLNDTDFDGANSKTTCTLASTYPARTGSARPSPTVRAA